MKGNQVIMPQTGFCYRSIQFCHYPICIPVNTNNNMQRTPRKKAQSFRGDPQKRAKIKTELCKNFMNLGRCEFGVKCSYAHGGHELRLTKLHEWDNFVDICTFRSRPCLDWVSTGACPFQDRCEFLHDPSAEGRIPSWLRDTQKHDSNIQTDVHINNLQQLNVQSIHKTDFGVLCPIKHPSQNLFKDWTNAVDIVCNKSTSFNPEMFGIKRKHMIQIILKLRPKCGNSHTYQDTHMVFDRLCMVLDARSYCISGDKMIEIDYHPHNPHHKGIITAHHIVFHPDQLLDSKCPTAIYFNIPAHEISACFHDPKKDKNLDFSKLSQVKQCHSKCYFFKLVSALDKEIDHLIVDILQDHQSKLFDNCVQKKDFDLKEMAMISRFNSLRLFFELWAYPVNASIDMSRGNISQSTKKPEVTSTYDIPVSSCNVGKASRIAWDSFCHQSQSCKKKSNRLPIFQKLEYRIWEDQNIARNNIHIKDFATSLKVSQKSERCWKSILLPNHNDWDLVKHQIRERNKKTLSQ